MTPPMAFIENHKSIKQLRARHEESFAALYEHYGRRIYGLALRMTGNPQEAEDITQETFLQAYRHIGNFKGESRIYTWLYRIAKNLCYRTVKRHQASSFHELEELIQSAPRNGLPPDIERMERLYRIEQVKEGCLTGMVRCLSFSQRTAFILHVLLKLPVKEVAAILDKSEGAVKVQVHRARQNLKGFLCRNCSLFKPENSCRCEGLVDFSLKQGWISTPSAEDLDAFKQNHAEMIEKELEELRKLTELYTSLSEPHPPANLAQRLQQEIKNQARTIFPAEKV